ncbi:MAG: class I SAM-dependent methyltransferase, partial [Verrucomicrobia bacterium]|nr:class I SAM-dependent methyltransferase [Verrucomicrobiota bacterium]
VPLFGLIFCRDAHAYSYILDSLDHYPAQRGIDELLRCQGFIQTSWQNIIGGTMSLSTAFKRQ